jgi:hypothetical protein
MYPLTPVKSTWKRIITYRVDVRVDDRSGGVEEGAEGQVQHIHVALCVSTRRTAVCGLEDPG